jgi:hypothetical protein
MRESTQAQRRGSCLARPDNAHVKEVKQR